MRMLLPLRITILNGSYTDGQIKTVAAESTSLIFTDGKHFPDPKHPGAIMGRFVDGGPHFVG